MLSVIITTYNWPKALNLALTSLESQLPEESEIIIADDGSSSETAKMVEAYQNESKHHIIHLWQEDLGFRAARARNLAIKQARGDYCIFLDGDCIPSKHFIKRHLTLREKGFFVAGNRVLFSQQWTQTILEEGMNPSTLSLPSLLYRRLEGHINRILPLMAWPDVLRHKKGFKWKGVKTCNLAVWREDLIKVNGFDEAFLGWGYEDSELVVRLLNSGVGHKSGRFSTPVFHLWHKENPRENEAGNFALLQERIEQNASVARQGLNTV